MRDRRQFRGPRGPSSPAHAKRTRQRLVAVKPLGKMTILVLFCFSVALGQFLTNVGPKTPLDGSGSKDGAEGT